MRAVAINTGQEGPEVQLPHRWMKLFLSLFAMARRRCSLLPDGSRVKERCVWGG